MTDDPERGSVSQGRWVPPAFHWPAMSDEQMQVVRGRQRARAIVMAVLLGGFAVLVFAISIAKIKAGHPG